MRLRKLLTSSAVSLALVTVPATALLAQDADLESEKAKLSYGLGVLISENLKQQDFGERDYDLLIKGLQENTAGEAQLTAEEARVQCKAISAA